MYQPFFFARRARAVMLPLLHQLYLYLIRDGALRDGNKKDGTEAVPPDNISIFTAKNYKDFISAMQFEHTFLPWIVWISFALPQKMHAGSYFLSMM